MLNVHHISKSFGIDTVLNDITFSLSPGDRVGLVGPNGCGKTTLLRILMGLENADSGSFSVDPPGLRVGYLAQGFDSARVEDVQFTIGAYIEQASGDLTSLADQVDRLAQQLSSSPDRQDLPAQYDAALAKLSAAVETSAGSKEILAALGLDNFAPDTPVAYLSGGQKTRLALAGVLISGPELLLLDEPTNHLDIAMLEWLEGWLARPTTKTTIQAVLFVSHDRAFLDQVATAIYEIDLNTHQLRQYTGNYTAYLDQKLAEREKQKQAYADQQEEIERLTVSMRQVMDKARFRKGGKADSGDKFAKGFFANRSKGTIRRAKQIEARIDRLKTDERVDKPGLSWQMKLDFGEVETGSKDILLTEDLAVGYDGQPLLEGLNLHLRSGDRVALTGENGSGKTTLLRTLTGVIPPISGSFQIGPSVRVGVMTQEQEDLDPSLDAFETVRREGALTETEARSFLHYFLFAGDDVFVPVGKLSYGERARLSLARLVARGCTLLLLDEPINHLDIPSRARFEQALAAYRGTVLAVVHDRYFIDGFATALWQIDGRGVKVIL